MDRKQAFLGAIVLAFLLVAATSASAGTISLTYISSGNSFTGDGPAGAAPTTSYGGGSITSIMSAAAAWWEVALPDANVSIEYGWQDLAAPNLGVHVLTGQSGSPNRETAGYIRFDNSLSDWFLDSTPGTAEEWSTYTESSADLGGGTMNVGRVYTGASGDAAGHYDLFSVALHEIGHALGLSGANTSFSTENSDGDIDLGAGLPYAGAAIATTSGAHLDLANALMYPSIGTGIRRLGSEADILTMVQLSQFDNFDLSPSAVPLPSAALMGFALIGLLAGGRRVRRLRAPAGR
jgi:hypothetical protein